MNAILNNEVINKMILNRLKAFVETNYGTYSAFANALGMTTSTITSMFTRESLPSGAILAGIKKLHPNFNLDLLFQDVVDGVETLPVDASLFTNETKGIDSLISFLKNNEIRLNVTINNPQAPSVG